MRIKAAEKAVAQTRWLFPIHLSAQVGLAFYTLLTVDQCEAVAAVH